MQADDIVASMEKSMKTSTQGKANLSGAVRQDKSITTKMMWRKLNN